MPPHLMIEYNYLIRQWNGGITIEKLHLRISVFNNFFRKKACPRHQGNILNPDSFMYLSSG
jgi:hypothetical protein